MWYVETLATEWNDSSLPFQLEGFLKQRLIELESEESSFSINQFSSAPISVQDQSKEQLEVMVSHIRNVIDPLGTNKMQHLFLIYSSPKYEYLIPIMYETFDFSYVILYFSIDFVIVIIVFFPGMLIGLLRHSGQN